MGWAKETEDYIRARADSDFNVACFVEVPRVVCGAPADAASPAGYVGFPDTGDDGRVGEGYAADTQSSFQHCGNDTRERPVRHHGFTTWIPV